MRLEYRQIPSVLLLVACASVSLLGEGLHLLVPGLAHHHCHHHARFVVSHSRHGAPHELVHKDHRHDSRVYAHIAPRPSAALAELTRGDENAESHACGICAFLFEGVGVSSESSAALECRPVAAGLQVQVEVIDSQTWLGPQAPRGPPALS